MSQSQYNQVTPYEFSQSPSHTLTVAPKVIRTMGKDKSEDWRDGAAAALLAVEIGLRRDGVMPQLIMQNKIAELEQEKAELDKKLLAVQSLNAAYRQKLIGEYEPQDQAA